MNYSATFELQDEFLETTVIGERNSETLITDTLDILSEIDRYARKSKHNKILIKWNLDGETNRKLPLDVVSAIEGVPISKAHRIAFIFDSGKVQKTNKVIEKLAKVLGWEIKFFQEELPAKQWLLKEESN